MDRGQDHTLALYRFAAAALFAGWVVMIGVVAEQQAQFGERQRITMQVGE